MTSDDRNCILQASLATPEQERYVYDNLTEIRRSFTALRRMRIHINNTILPYLLALRPTNSCIESLVNVRCQACVEDIPDNCRGVCNALTFGCLAPFREGIGAQFDLMWNVTMQIVNLTNDILPNARIMPRKAYSINISNAEAVKNLVRQMKLACTLIHYMQNLQNANNSSRDVLYWGMIILK